MNYYVVIIRTCEDTISNDVFLTLLSIEFFPKLVVVFFGEKKSGEWTVSRKMRRRKEQEDWGGGGGGGTPQ